MFDKFSDRAKLSMSQARLAALRLQHDFIATEHMLLGLLAVDPCGATERLRQLGVDPVALRERCETSLPRGPAPVTQSQLPFTPAAKKALEATFTPYRHDRRIGTEHLLFGLCSSGTHVAEQVLTAAGVTADAIAATLPAAEAAEALPPDTRARRLLLISNSTMHGGGYLEHCTAEIRDFLGSKKRVLFVPYALANHDEYTAKARTAFQAMGHDLISAHEAPGDTRALDLAEAVFVGGGNTFRLLTALYRTGLLAAIRKRAFAGMPYIGSSAGTNVATLSIRTTNDMPIVMPPSFTALELVPFQINPHYLDPVPGSTHMGETREERLRQFHEEHATPVLGLREGCMLRVEGDRMTLRGTTRARLFRRAIAAEEFSPPCDLSFLLQSKS